MHKIIVSNDLKAVNAIKERLYEIVDKKTVLFLSGGKTPVPLYRKLVKEKILSPGAVGMVDERWGKPMHPGSNEQLLNDIGFLEYLNIKNVPFHSMLQNGKSFEEVSREYDELVRYLLNWFPNSVSILGMGTDGHIAGIPPGSERLKEKNEKFVENFTDFPGDYRERISLTFNALSQMNQNLLLVLGNDKKKSLKLFLDDEVAEETPASFLKQPQVTDKIVLITDQRV